MGLGDLPHVLKKISYRSLKKKKIVRFHTQIWIFGFLLGLAFLGLGPTRQQQLELGTFCLYLTQVLSFIVVPRSPGRGGKPPFFCSAACYVTCLVSVGI